MLFLDLISRDKDEKSVLLKGWAFDENDKEPLVLEVEADEKVKEVLQKPKFREDVNEAYKLDKSKEYGFIAKIKLEDLKGNLKLKFINPKTGYKETLDFDLNRKILGRKELAVQEKFIKKSLANARQILSSGNGLRYLMNRFKKQIPGTDPVYARWIAAHEGPQEQKVIEQEIEAFKYKPLISLLVPVFNVSTVWLEKMLQSVLNQTYSNWQLCIADDNSTDSRVKDYLINFYESVKNTPTGEKIKIAFRPENGGISEATNTAFELSSGEFIGLLDNDDELSPDALFEVVKYINEHPEVDIIYSDEDKIDVNGFRNEPYFKPDFSPDSLLSNNYICHFTVIRRSLLKEGEELMRKGYEGAQDHDLLLRLVERTNNIGHIPKILYHWRALQGSTALNADYKEYAAQAGVHAVKDALNRRGYSGKVEPLKNVGFYEVTYDPEGSQRVSIIIPTKNNAGEIRKCVESIVLKTEYPNYEIVIVDNGSDDEDALKNIEALKNRYPDLIRVLPLPIPFNYSRINNRAADFATGDVYVFLNDDTEVITKGWIKKMLGYAEKPWIGCVGAKLLYPDSTIQHAGVIMGILGIGGHVFTKMPRDFPGYFRRCELNVNYTAVTAACLMIERDKFWQVGGFDENIAVAFNDVDLCCKLANAGYYNIYLGRVELFHYESKSRGYETTADREVRFNKEKGKVIRKWRKYIEHDPMYNPNLTLMRGDYSINA